MNQIRPWLYIGKYRETLDYRYLTAHNITAMLLLAELEKGKRVESCKLSFRRVFEEKSRRTY